MKPNTRTPTVHKPNLYRAIPTVGAGIDQYPTRAELRRRLARLCDEILPLLADREDFPITEGHCFRRVAYDLAVGGVWSDVIPRPFVEHASHLQLCSAYRASSWMVREGHPAVTRGNDMSLGARRTSSHTTGGRSA